MSLIKPGPDWCSVVRVPTALTWADVDNARETREDRAQRVRRATGESVVVNIKDSVAIDVKPPNLTMMVPGKPLVRWSK
jgi:hypothetical protein